MDTRKLVLFAVAIAWPAVPARAETTVLTPGLHHLRGAGAREWSDFPATPEGPGLSLGFQARPNADEWSLRLRQQDVKQTWKVLLNGKELGRLAVDENDMVVYLPVPADRLLAGENRLRIEQVGATPDDIRVGEITLDDRPVARVLAEAAVEVTVTEDGRAPVPCRITVLTREGALMTVGASSGPGLAVRPGVIYTASGKARFGLPAGEYTICAGRGFAYGLDRVTASVRAGDVLRKALSIRREVPTGGYVSCDPHIHCLTWSGHGDATADERVVAIAGEGVELPVSAEHNRHVDYHAAAVRQGVRACFTPVVGNEVTTEVGHFTVFPVPAAGPVPDSRGRDWPSVFSAIAGSGAKVIVLNHPRDLHAGFRPLGPARHLALTGTDLDGWALKANAIEVVNSGAQQTDLMRLYRDWFGLLNHGLTLTPIGASDSHDVSRFLVGQARTYVRCKSGDPGKIDVEEAFGGLLQGRVMVSCGLLAEITVNGSYGPGDVVPLRGEVEVAVRVLGPSWTTADRVELYANGIKVREALIRDGTRAGVKWSGVWTLPRPRHDTHLVAVASGPGVSALYWPITRPYQPTSSVVRRRVVGSTGAVWLDADGDGQRTSARALAGRLLQGAAGDWRTAVKAIAGYDEAVAHQAADLLRARGVAVGGWDVLDAAREAGPGVGRAFEEYWEAWRECQVARQDARR